MRGNRWDLVILDASVPRFVVSQRIPVDALEHVGEGFGPLCITPRVHDEIRKRKLEYPYRDFFAAMASEWYDRVREVDSTLELLNEIEERRSEVARLVRYLGQNLSPADSEVCSAAVCLADSGTRLALISDDEDVSLYFDLAKNLLGWGGEILTTYELFSTTDRAYLLGTIEKLFSHYDSPISQHDLQPSRMCGDQSSFQRAVFHVAGKRFISCHPRVRSFQQLTSFN